MDLGIAGRTALVCASSRGLGRACAEALAAEGVHVVINGRDAERLERTASEIRLIAKGDVRTVQADVVTVEGRATLLAACPEPDILINNNAGPTPTNFMDVNEAVWMSALEGNMIAALMLVQGVLPAMRRRRFGRIVNITSAMVTAPRAHQILSAGSRAGLTAVLKGVSVDIAADNVTINNMLPERFDTDRQVQMAKIAMKKEGITWEEARRRQVERSPAKRLGDPKEFGAACAFLCSAYAGYISGQNLHLDGAAYPGLV